MESAADWPPPAARVALNPKLAQFRAAKWLDSIKTLT